MSAAWQSKIDLRLEDDFLAAKNTGTDPMYGVGLGAWLDNALIRLEYERLDVGRGSAGRLSRSLL